MDARRALVVAVVLAAAGAGAYVLVRPDRTRERTLEYLDATRDLPAAHKQIRPGMGHPDVNRLVGGPDDVRYDAAATRPDDHYESAVWRHRGRTLRVVYNRAGVVVLSLLE